MTGLRSRRLWLDVDVEVDEWECAKVEKVEEEQAPGWPRRILECERRRRKGEPRCCRLGSGRSSRRGRSAVAVVGAMLLLVGGRGWCH